MLTATKSTPCSDSGLTSALASTQRLNTDMLVVLANGTQNLF
jgi:hypothetical protein